jgi:hypothetical protein
MLAAISAILLVVGATFSTASVVGEDREAVGRSGESAPEVRVVEKTDALSG